MRWNDYVLEGFRTIVDMRIQDLEQAKQDGQLGEEFFRESVRKIVDAAIDAAKEDGRDSIERPDEIKVALFKICPGCRPWC